MAFIHGVDMFQGYEVRVSNISRPPEEVFSENNIPSATLRTTNQGRSLQLPLVRGGVCLKLWQSHVGQGERSTHLCRVGS